ncbi:MAG: PIG-L family deacetylase [Armatimonadota bacterium]|nr:PIG-L family deacetylase [bacterium]
MSKIIAFAAHPDDIEFACAGTLAKYKAAGWDVGIAISTNGEVGSPTLSKAEIAAVRKAEASASASLIGAEFFWLGYPDEFLFNNRETRLHYINVIRQFRPDIIICPDKDSDYHPDHTTTGQIIWDTHVMVTVPNIETKALACEKIPEIFYMDTVAGVNFMPEFYIDISDYWDTKEAMIACHKSQDSWMVDQYGVSTVEFGKTASRYRGFQAGCKYAEAFRKPKFFPGNTTRSQLMP